MNITNVHKRRKENLAVVDLLRTYKVSLVSDIIIMNHMSQNIRWNISP
jgi:hypothetical protein